jgi:hypothetical protein
LGLESENKVIYKTQSNADKSIITTFNELKHPETISASIQQKLENINYESSIKFIQNKLA